MRGGYRGALTIAAVIIAALALGGCTIRFDTSAASGVSASRSGGVYKSDNFGQSWKQQSSIATTSGKPSSFGSANVTAIAIDPQDPQAVYAGTDENGMVYSYDGGASWTSARSLGRRPIMDIAIHPRNKCVIYVASENKIYRSSDCSRNWEQLYFDNALNVRIYTLAIDAINPSLIYAGTSRGELLESTDGGVSWKAKHRFSEAKRAANDSAVIKVVINPKDSKNLWVATPQDGVYASADQGRTWTSFAEELREVNSAAVNVNDIVVAPSDGKTVVVATDAGLLRSKELGKQWQVIDIIPPKQRTPINQVAISYQDATMVYYGTNTSFALTRDDGKTWESRKLPSPRAVSALTVDHTAAKTVYLGFLLVEEK